MIILASSQDHLFSTIHLETGRSIKDPEDDLERLALARKFGVSGYLMPYACTALICKHDRAMSKMSNVADKVLQCCLPQYLGEAD